MIKTVVRSGVRDAQYFYCALKAKIEKVLIALAFHKIYAIVKINFLRCSANEYIILKINRKL